MVMFGFRAQEAAVTCSTRAGVGSVRHCWKRGNCLLFPQVFAQAGAGKTDNTETEMSIVILHFPELVFPFCVMQNDCNWECIWNNLPLWLSNMSALLFMFVCQVCNSYKLLLHDRLLHLNFSLLNSSPSFFWQHNNVTPWSQCICPTGGLLCGVFCGHHYTSTTVLVNKIPLKYCFRVDFCWSLFSLHLQLAKA